MLRYNHQADQIRHKLKYGLEFEQRYPKNAPPVDDLLPDWNTESGRQYRFRKLLLLSIITAVLLISLSPWKAAFSTAFTFNTEDINDNSIVWVSDTTVEVGQPYTLLALVKDTGDISAKLFLNDMKINHLYKNDTLSYFIESVNQDLHFTWRDGDKILSSFQVEVRSTLSNTYKVLLIPPSYLEQEQVEFINPRKIEAMEGSVMRIQEYVDKGASTLESLSNIQKNSLGVYRYQIVL